LLFIVKGRVPTIEKILRDDENMNTNRIWLSSPTIHGDEMPYIQKAFDTNWVAPLGPNVTCFEKEIADYIGVKHAAALISGTAALHLAVKLAGVKPGDIVFCSDLTFSATVNPVSYEGGKQVFIDSERETWNMDPRTLENAFIKYSKCKVVIVVHLYGTPAKIDEIKAICDNYGAVLIEDAAESLSATYKGQQTGVFGDYAALSFNGNKIITTSGGGMLLSNDKDAIAKAKFWATQSREAVPWYEHKEIGYNYRMSNIVAGIGRAQLKHLEEHRILKKGIYFRYKEGFDGLPVTMNPWLQCSEPNFWLSCLLLDKGVQIKPLDIIEELGRHNIETRPIWKPMHLQPVFSSCDFISVDGDVSKDIFSRGLCLPSDIKMTKEEQDKVIHIIRGMLR
jgi:dTDP-4-amino-4,6-dideoxygalactose transaminase